jgi:poly(hydroxyalkanoate) depolymerase family esterase
MPRHPTSASRCSRLALASASLALAACYGGGSPVESTGSTSQAVSALAQVSSFGTNPGNLLMFDYVPAGMPSTAAPLVLALHGCTQSASDYESAGWNALADTYKFYVVYPQQQSANNTETCFNWFGNTSGSTEDITRGEGEAASIIEMIKNMEASYSVDTSRVYITGFSAGAAYAVAMLAMYPDVFAAGASFSGLPFGCANSLSTAETCMAAPPSKTPSQWGTLGQAGFPGYSGPYPRISVWQGSDDTTVSTQNLAAIVAQWTDLTGASTSPTTTNTVATFPHDEYADSKGVVQVESYSITGMSHAVAIDAPNGCGTAGTYYVDEGICAVGYVAKFFGLEGSGSGGGGGGSSSGSGSGSGSSSGGGSGSGSGGTGSSSGGPGPGDDAGIGGSGSGTNSAAALDAGAAAVPTPELPGCSVGMPGRPGADARATGWVLAGLALGLLAARTRATRRNVR